MIHDATMWFYPAVFLSVYLSPVVLAVNVIVEVIKWLF